MIYVWAAVAIIILFLLVRLAKWIVAPRVEQERTERWTSWLDFRKWRRENGGLIGWRRRRDETP
jgi:hypothetical protein